MVHRATLIMPFGARCVGPVGGWGRIVRVIPMGIVGVDPHLHDVLVMHVPIPHLPEDRLGLEGYGRQKQDECDGTPHGSWGEWS